jgi:hypothetical protein
VKAALLLLPLLGLTNMLHMVHAPLEKSAWVFGIWSYSTHLLTSCQGLILSCLYCFNNGEVSSRILTQLDISTRSGSMDNCAHIYYKIMNIKYYPIRNMNLRIEYQLKISNYNFLSFSNYVLSYRFRLSLRSMFESNSWAVTKSDIHEVRPKCHC